MVSLEWKQEKEQYKMILYGVFLGISNGINAWAVHSIIDGKEGFFIETSPALVSFAQATHLVDLIKGHSDLSTTGELIEIKLLLTLKQNSLRVKK